MLNYVESCVHIFNFKWKIPCHTCPQVSSAKSSAVAGMAAGTRIVENKGLFIIDVFKISCQL
jgi:hypothetical protein